ncbi:hypothetical protein BLA15816_01657 [Burkholderia lata]|nr:hypothetical protein BLA15816_01657 [Burkholderia lata]
MRIQCVDQVGRRPRSRRPCEAVRGHAPAGAPPDEPNERSDEGQTPLFHVTITRRPSRVDACLIPIPVNPKINSDNDIFRLPKYRCRNHPMKIHGYARADARARRSGTQSATHAAGRHMSRSDSARHGPATRWPSPAGVTEHRHRPDAYRRALTRDDDPHSVSSGTGWRHAPGLRAPARSRRNRARPSGRTTSPARAHRN